MTVTIRELKRATDREGVEAIPYAPGPGTWLLASTLLGYDVAVGKRYPHICNIVLPAAQTESKMQDLYYRRRDCAACARRDGR